MSYCLNDRFAPPDLGLPQEKYQGFASLLASTVKKKHHSVKSLAKNTDKWNFFKFRLLILEHAPVLKK